MSFRSFAMVALVFSQPWSVAFGAAGDRPADERAPRTPAEIDAARARMSTTHPMSNRSFSVANLRRFIEQNAADLRSPEDFVCSIPSRVRQGRDVIAAPASLAAQSGTPRSPRALIPVGPLEDSSGNPTPPVAVASANGGVDGVHQGNAVELAAFLPNGAIEYYDLDFNEIPPRLSEPNPAVCMGCHGREGVVGVARVRPIVERIPWVSFIGQNLEQRLCSQIEVDAYRALRGQSEAAARSNPRLACLSERAFAPTPGPIGSTNVSEARMARLAADETRARAQGREAIFQEPEVVDADPVRRFDRSMAAVNSLQIAQLMRQTPDFERYKFVLVGLDVCPIEDFAELKRWVPDVELARLTNVSSVARGLQQASAPMEGFQEELRRMERDDAVRARQLESYARNPRGAAFPMFSENVTACLPAARRRELTEDVREAIGQNRTYGLYVADSRLQTVRDAPDSTQPMLRFLLEGRGVSMRGWNIEPIHDRYTRPLSGYALAVVQGEREGSILRSLFQTGVRRGLSGFELDEEELRARRENRAPRTTRVVGSQPGIPANVDQLCVQLRASSRQALSRPPAEAGRPAATAVTR